MRSTLITVTIIFCSFVSNAQKWLPGHFTDVKNNRMEGLIQPSPSGKGPVKDEGFIIFKENNKAPEIKLSTSDLKSFVAGADSFVVAHPPMGQSWANELDFVKVVLNEPLKLYTLKGGGTGKGGSGIHFSPGLSMGVGGGSYGGGGLGIDLGGGGGSGGGKQRIAYYFGANTAELTEVTPQNFEDVMIEIMGDEPAVVDHIKNHQFGLGNIDKLIAYFKQVKASHQ